MRAKRGWRETSEIFYIFREAIARKVVATGAANAINVLTDRLFIYSSLSLL